MITKNCAYQNNLALTEIPLRLCNTRLAWLLNCTFWIMNCTFFCFNRSLDCIEMALDNISIFCCKYPLIIYVDQIDIKDLLRMSKRRRTAFWLCSELWKRPTTEMKTETKEDPKQDEFLILFRLKIYNFLYLYRLKSSFNVLSFHEPWSSQRLQIQGVI